MRINLSNPDARKVSTLLKTKEFNMETAEMLLYFLANKARSIRKRAIENLVTSIQVTEPVAYSHLLLKAIGINERDTKSQELERKYFLKGIKKLNSKVYLDNLYFKNIKTDGIKSKNWEIRNEHYSPYQGFVYNDVFVDEKGFFLEITPIGYFETDFSYLALSEKSVTWMSVTPFEIETMQPVIDSVKGKVITFGLGLGYFAYMASMKDDVESVTIIENNEEVISLFKENLLPQFLHKEKITIISKDAFEYAEKNMGKGNYDFAFVDLWHSADDGLLPYLKMKKLELRNQKTKYYYWLEKSIIAMIRRCVLIVLEEQMNGSLADDYQTENNKFDIIINRIYQMKKNLLITNYEDVAELILDPSIKKIATDF